MKRFLLSILFASIGLTGFCTTWVVTTPGFEFSPATITIALGDSVRFTIGGIHRVEEVSEAVWNANGSTPLPGFNTPFGGALILPAQLTEGTHWYVCVPHASGGMKGRIIVQNTTGIRHQPTASALKLFPNPSNGVFQLELDKGTPASYVQLDVYDIQGTKVYAARNLEQQSVHEIDLTSLSKGLYTIRISDGVVLYSNRLVIQ